MATNGAMVTPPKWTTQEIALHFFDFTKRSITLGRKGLVDLGRCYLYQLSVILRFFVVLCGFDPHINQIHTKRRGAVSSRGCVGIARNDSAASSVRWQAALRGVAAEESR